MNNVNKVNKARDTKILSFRALFTLFTLLTLFTFSLWASKGATSAQFLALAPDPRAVAMGEIGAAGAVDAHACYWNPAGLAELNSPQLVLAHNRHFQDITQQYLAFAHPLRRATPALSVTRLGVRPFDAYNSSGQRIGSVDSQNLSAVASLGAAITPNFNIGLSGKWIQEDLGPARAAGAALDLGLLWKLPSFARQNSQKLTVGASYANLGRGLRFDAEKFPLPQTGRLGLGLSDEIKKHPVNLSLEGRLPKNEKNSLAGGGEIGLYDGLSLRAGYRLGQDIGSGLRLGFGLKTGAFALDYAWAGFGDLGVSHRVGLKFNFQGWPDMPQMSQNLLGR